MNAIIGQINKLKIVEEKEFGLLLDAGSKRILLPRKEMPENFQIGDILDVFIYLDSDDRVIATTRRPLAMAGDFACLRVRAVNNIGAFLDWGLEKDLLLPFRRQLDPVAPGQLVVVKVLLDEVSSRLMATTRLKAHFERPGKSLNPGKKVEALLFQKTDRGWKAIVGNQYQGMIYHNDFFQEPEIGERFDAFIRKIRPDGLLDLSLRKAGFSDVKEKAPDILNLLKANGGFLPYHDKSDPQVIADTFAMSKKTFKKSIGTLKKKGIIEIEKEGIRLL